MRGSAKGAGRSRSAGIGSSLLLPVLLLALGAPPAVAAPKAEPWLFWAAGDPAGRLNEFRGKISYDYDWRINAP